GSSQPGTEYIPQLWAAREAGALSSDIRRHGANPEIVTELKRLALRYGILTAYTSYLVQEPRVAARAIPLPAAMPRDQAGVGAVQQSQRERRHANSYNRDAVMMHAAPVAESLAAAPGDRAGRS